MNTPKRIEAVLPPPPANMVGDGFRVHNFFPNGYRIQRRTSPFFLLDYNSPVEFPATDRPRGVGVHPHRGFETVTIAYQGHVAHHDSAGNSGVIDPGDVQWMTAGSGVLHKEYHEEAFSRSGGPFQMVQLWVNLPAKDKMTAPRYQGIRHADKGMLTLPEGAGTMHVIAGNYRGAQGPAHTFSPIEMYDVRLHARGVLDLDLPAAYNTGILVVQGAVTVNGEAAAADHFVLFKNEGTSIHVEAGGESILLVLSGEPINEPIAHYGPFLMNTPEQVQQAIADFGTGKFGVLED